MAESTDPHPARTGRVITGYCRLDAHSTCQPGDVVTCYGDVALTIRCDCPCHKGVR